MLILLLQDSAQIQIPDDDNMDDVDDDCDDDHDGDDHDDEQVKWLIIQIVKIGAVPHGEDMHNAAPSWLINYFNN